MIPSAKTFFKNLHYYVFFPIPMANEVGFSKEVTLQDHQIQVVHYARWTLPFHYIGVIARAAFRVLTVG